MTTKNDAVSEQQLAPWLDVVEKQVQQLRFGVVQIVVHDSRVVQIERTEKVRLAPSSDSRPGR